MSVDPVGTGLADLAALVDAELAALASDAQALRAALVENAVVQARVLPPNGLTDLLEIAGYRVAAALPPTVRPGDTLTVKVSGFEGDQILVQIVADQPAQERPPNVPLSPARITPPGGYAAAPGAPRGAAPGVPTSIEARLAAARASVTRATSAPAPAAARAAMTPPQARYVLPLQIAAKTPLGAAASPVAPANTSAPAARTTGLSAYTEPVALLRALRLPVTPSTVASATLALQRPEQLPKALAILARALPQGNADPQVATLRTLLAFVGRIEPDSPTLATQIAAFVDQIVDGGEPKLATLLAASRAVASPAPAASAPSAAPDDPLPAQLPAPPTLPAAVVVERSAAVDADLKQTLLAVASDPQTPAAIAPAIAGALTAVSAVQLQAAQLLTAQPDGIAFTLPLATPSGNANARIAIKRDAPQGRGNPVDGENFRIAFVLDTAHYGTVAIDLVTVGREVTVDLRAENGSAMRAFRDGLGGLCARLEGLRYRVASAQAALGTTTTIGVAAPPTAPPDPDANVDRSA